MTLRKRPLVVFVVLGAAIWGLWSVGVADGTASAGESIVITQADVDRLKAGWERQWQRPPTERELAGLVDGYLREEVFYRQALAMGLDRDDLVVRRRMAQKLELLAEDLATASEPTEMELEALLVAESDRFEIPPRATFRHVYLSLDRPGDESEVAAARLLERLEGSDPDGAEGLGDRFMLPSRFVDVEPRQVASQFGTQFSDRVFELNTGAWQGPIRSGYGLHLVYVEDLSPARAPELGEVRDDVRMELLSRRRQEATQRLFDSLRESYRVEIEPESVEGAVAALRLEREGTGG